MSAVSTPELSPVLSAGGARKLSARRGSVAAADPWGAYNEVNMNPLRSLTSRLTIVRVPQHDLEEPPRRHRRHGSNASLNSNASGKSDHGPGSRLSFAFSSFSPPGGTTVGSGRPASPSGSPRFRPSSPSSSRFPAALPNHSKLSPDQLMEVARISVNPRSPLPSPGGPLASAQFEARPVSFTPLPESIYLPFIDRPAEVASLIESQPNARLFALLQQTFPLDARASMGSNYNAANAPSDPKDWVYADLEYWLKQVDRDVTDDAHWARKARRCVITHSELIWERVKGALGVPPELDIEEEAQELPDAPSAPVTSDSLESNVFEPDSPVSSSQSSDDVVIEPVFADEASQPEPSGGLGSSLTDLREEDETEDAGDKAEQQKEVRGLRITTSSPVFASDHAACSVPNMSPVVKFASPAGSNDKDMPYDVLRERGPGHPLFPSNFTQLSISPTLRPSKRTMSVSGFPPRPAYGSPHAIRGGASMFRTNSIDAVGRTAGMLRPEWARNWDPSKHEYAVTTASTGSVNGAE